MADELDQLRELGRELSDPDEEGVRRARSLLEQRIAAEGVGARRGPRLRRRWTVAIAATLVLVGSALGFGLGSSLTPSGTAGTTFAGFGFLPASGWTVVQAGTLDPSGAATAIAATVPLHPDDVPEGVPRATLRSLPPHAVLIRATFKTRGNAETDATFDVRPMPLDVADAAPVRRSSSEYSLRAAVGGYNVEARIYFGTAPPSPQMLAEAQLQLSRLVVQSERITITARPTVVGFLGRTELFGSVDGAKEGDGVTIQQKDCGKDFFRVVGGTTTMADGTWSILLFPFVSTSVRAIWNDVASRQITIQRRVIVGMSRHPSAARRFTIRIAARNGFRDKRVVIQRLDARLGTWSNVRTVRISAAGGAGNLVVSSAEFTLRVPKGSQLRAVFPLSQALPCYLGGTSQPIRA